MPSAVWRAAYDLAVLFYLAARGYVADRDLVKLGRPERDDLRHVSTIQVAHSLAHGSLARQGDDLVSGAYEDRVNVVLHTAPPVKKLNRPAGHGGPVVSIRLYQYCRS